MLLPHTLPITVPTLIPALGGYLGDAAEAFQKDGTFTANYTLVQKYQPAQIVATGNYIQLVVRGPLTAGTTTVISNTYIGKPATSGDAWDFTSSPTRVTWSGSNSITLETGQYYSSDVITYTLDDVPTIIAFDIASGSTARYRSGLNSSNVTLYYKSGVAEAGTVDKGASYIALGGYQYLVHILQTGV